MKALQSVVEKVSTHVCEIIWPGESRDDLTNCPQMPKVVKVLEVRGFQATFRNRVPSRWGQVNAGHWIHKTVRELKSLDVLKIEREGMSRDDFVNLQAWFSTTAVRRT